MARSQPDPLLSAGLSPQQREWQQWLCGQLEEMDETLELPCGTTLDDEASAQLRCDLTLVEWLFPADRYGEADSAAPQLATSEVTEFLDVRGMDARIRTFYVGFLDLLGASVDCHGWVDDWRIERPTVWKLTELTPQGIRAVARVLRCLHLAGWRGFSPQPNFRDRHDFWYDRALRRWLVSTWERQGGAAWDFPALWNEALKSSVAPVAAQPGGTLGSSLVNDLLGRCQRRVVQFDDTLYDDVQGDFGRPVRETDNERRR